MSDREIDRLLRIASILSQLDNWDTTCHNHLMLSSEQRARVLEAIAECDRYIAKESARADDLRPAEATALLIWYRAHRLKLEGLL